MTWSYTGNPSDSNKDEVRFLIGDTDFDDQLVEDEEINYAIAVEANNTLAAIRIARALAGKFSRKVDKSVGDLRLSYSQQAKNFRELAKFLENSNSTATIPIPYAGGISRSNKKTVREDSDRVPGSFSRGMHDDPGIPYPQTEDDTDND